MGRLPEYRNAADKQKAYRERLKEALDPYRSLRYKLHEANKVVQEATRAHEQHIANGAPLDDIEYRHWVAENTRIVGVWWDAHCASIDILKQIPREYR